MTPDSLLRLNDLRMRLVQSDEARRAGNEDLANSIAPSDDEIIEALRAARTERAAALQKKADKTTDKAAVDKFRTMSVNDLFS